jgi:hypothetical protein
MHSPSSLAATAALLVASFVVAAPVADPEAPRLEGRSTFSIPQVPNPGFKGFHASGTAARAKAYAKYGIAMPEDLAAAVSKATQQGKILQSNPA